MDASAPVIETERLRLRLHTLDDLANCTAMWAAPRTNLYLGGKTATEAQVWGRLLRYVGHWALHRYGYWLIEERAGGAFVGEIGFAEFRRDGLRAAAGTPEAGWALAPAMHGKGYASEALRAALDWGDRHFMAPHTLALIAPDNAPSLKLAQRFGYVERERPLFNGEPTLILQRKSQKG